MCPTITAMMIIGVVALLAAYQVNPKYVSGLAGMKSQEGLLVQCGGPSSDYNKSMVRTEDLTLPWFPQASVKYLEDTL